MVCLDTDILVGFLRRSPEALERIKKLKEANVELLTTPITEVELFEGAFRSTKPDAVAVVEGVLSTMKVLDFNTASSRNAGRIIAELGSGGRALEDMDAMIGAIALAHEETLITRNIRHFSRIENLRVESW